MPESSPSVSVGDPCCLLEQSPVKNYKGEKMKKLFSVVLSVLFIAASHAVSSPLPAECFNATGDYNFMWWTDGIFTNSVYAIQTNKYGLRVDWPVMFGSTGFDFFINYFFLLEFLPGFFSYERHNYRTKFQ